MKSKRIRCAHCRDYRVEGGRWDLQACADGRRKRSFIVCRRCDVELNWRMLEFFNVPKTDEMMHEYRRKMR